MIMIGTILQNMGEIMRQNRRPRVSYVYESSMYLSKSSIGDIKVLEVRNGHNCDIATYTHMPQPSKNCGNSYVSGWFVELHGTGTSTLTFARP